MALDALAAAVGVLTDKHVTSTAVVAGAEATLAALEEGDVSGLVSALLDVATGATSPPAPPAARKLCLTIAKRVVKRRWGEVAGAAGAVADGVKEGVRARLPALLADADGRVRALAAQTLGTVAVEDWPGVWPGFVPAVLDCLTAPLHEDGAAGPEALTGAWLRADGALQCIVDFMGDLDSRLVPRLAADLLPVLLHVAGMAATEAAAALVASAFGVGLRTACLRVVRATLEALAEAENGDEERAAAAGEVLDAQFGSCLAAAASCLADAGWGSRMCSQKLAAMRIIAIAAQCFPARMKPLLPDVARGVAGVLVGGLAAFRDLEVDADDTDAAVSCTDGVVPGPLDAMADEQDDCTPASVAIQALLFVQSCLLSPKKYMHKPFAPFVPDLGFLLASLAQLTEGQLSEWGNDVRAFALNETEEDGDRGVDLRHEVVETAGDLVSVFGPAALGAVLDAALASLCAGAGGAPPSPFAAFSAHRWKAVEAGLFLLGSLRKYIVNPGRATTSRKAPTPTLPFEVPTLLDQVLGLAAGGGEGAFTADEPAAIRAVCAPYVVGRALWTASRLCGADGVSQTQREAVLAACVAHLVPDQPAAERVLACRALHAVSPRVGAAAMEAAGPEILRRLTALIVRAIEASTAGGASGGSVLDADTAALEHIDLLVTTARFATAAAAADAGPITDLLLHLWARKGTHPLLAPSIVLGLRVMLTATALTDAGAAAGVMTAQAAVITSVMRALLVAIHNAGAPEGGAVRLPPLALPGGGELPLDDDVKDVELAVMAAAGCSLLEDILRRLRALQMPVGAGTPGDYYYTLPAELDGLLALVAQLVRTTDDHKVMVAGVQLLTVAVRLVGQHMPPTSDGTTLALDGVCATAARLLTDAEGVEDEVAAAAAPLIAALVSHTSSPATFIPLVLPALLHRLALARMPSFVTRLAHVVGHCLLHDAAVTLPVLAATSVSLPATGPLSLAAAATSASESSVLVSAAASAAAAGAAPTQPGHILFLRAAAAMLPWNPAPLSRGILLTAVMHLLSLPDVVASAAAVPAAGHREVAGSGSAAAGRRTRSKGAVEYVPVSLPAQLLKLLISEWAAAVEDEEEEAGDDDTDATSDGDSDGDDSEAGAGGAGGGGAGGGAARGAAKPRANPFMPAEALEELMAPAAAAEAEAEAKRAARRGRGGKRRGGRGDDAEDAIDLAYLSDLLAGGDALGNANSVAAMLAAGNTFHGGGDDDDSDDPDGVVDDLAGVARSDALDAIAAWDEVPEPGVEGVTTAPLPHDPVVAGFIAVDVDAQEVTEELPVAALQSFLQRVAGEAAAAPDSLIGQLVAATVPELAANELAMLSTRLGSGGGGGHA